jgi:hypothetical protein
VSVTARYVREWPRVTVAAVLLAVVLVLIGVIVANAATPGGRSQASTVRALRRTDAAQAVQLRSDDQTLASLRSTVSRDAAELASLQSSVSSSRALARCWQAKAARPHRAPACSPVP